MLNTARVSRAEVAPTWLIPKPTSGAKNRLFCFPYAGGDAWTFRHWPGRMPTGTEVCSVLLPGRWGRLQEEPFNAMQPLVEALANGLKEAFDVPFSFFGYSLGALIAFELTRHCRRQGFPMPNCVFIGACPAPQRPRKRTHLRALPEADFIREISSRYRPIPAAVLEDKELLAVTTRVMRADLSVVETYQYRQEEPLAVPMVALGGIMTHSYRERSSKHGPSKLWTAFP
ncbi:MAG: thioesterase domain-containing protein [Polyangiaceae bacterium]